MELTTNLQENIRLLKKHLPISKSFDVLERIIQIHDRYFYLYFIDGFAKDSSLEYVRRDLYALKPEDFEKIHTADDFIRLGTSCIETDTSSDITKIATAILSGQTAIFFDGSASVAIVDTRTYPSRGVEEPEKEKVLRGAKDGFVETVVFNTALIRRRIRDPHLVFEMVNIGEMSRTDVAIGYLSNKADPHALEKTKKILNSLKLDALTVSDRSLIEATQSKSWVNPFPKVRYTERPDIAAAQLMEGKIVIIVDNSPSVMIVPTSFFDFLQVVNDYYMPVLTGNYLRMIRNVVLLVNLFLTPVYVLLSNNPHWLPDKLNFLLIEEEFAIPIVLQFLILEIAIDGLNQASLSTPDVLGTSLSLIGGLILGEYAVKTGWLTSHAIFYMAIVALSSFAQPSVELNYAIKFMRILMLIGAGLLGVWGFLIAIIIDVICLARTKTFIGDPYLYPLIPFKWSALKPLLFRMPIGSKQKIKVDNSPRQQ
jgi:stage V sporulation protein AF